MVTCKINKFVYEDMQGLIVCAITFLLPIGFCVDPSLHEPILCGHKINMCEESDVDGCFQCLDNAYMDIIGNINKTVCIASEKIGTTVTSIINSLSVKTTTYLVIMADNTWQGIFPSSKDLVINLTSISHLVMLEGFELRQCYKSYLQRYFLSFQHETFLPLTKLRYFMLDISLGDQTLCPMFAPLCSLEVLYLKIRGSGISQMTAILSN